MTEQQQAPPAPDPLAQNSLSAKPREGVAATPNPPEAAKYSVFSVDSVTLLVALVAALATCGFRYKRGVQPFVNQRKFITDFLNGSVIYPFLLLVISPASVNIFHYIEESRLAVALAGVVGVAFVISELVYSCTPDDQKPNDQKPN